MKDATVTQAGQSALLYAEKVAKRHRYYCWYRQDFSQEEAGWRIRRSRKRRRRKTDQFWCILNDYWTHKPKQPVHKLLTVVQCIMGKLRVLSIIWNQSILSTVSFWDICNGSAQGFVCISNRTISNLIRTGVHSEYDRQYPIARAMLLHYTSIHVDQRLLLHVKFSSFDQCKMVEPVMSSRYVRKSERSSSSCSMLETFSHVHDSWPTWSGANYNRNTSHDSLSSPFGTVLQ